jgi:hypothetical protein
MQPFLKECSMGVWGFIIRDAVGDLVFARASLLQDALMAEAVARRKALEYAEQYRTSLIQLETNST